MKPIKLILAPLLILLFTGCPQPQQDLQPLSQPRDGLDDSQMLCLLDLMEARAQIVNLQVSNLEVKYGLIEARRVMRSPALQELENPNVSSGVNTPTRVWEDQ